MNEFTYTVHRSSRKTISIRITPEGQIQVRCPQRMKNADIHRFVEEKSPWIAKHLASIQARPQEPKFTPEEISILAQRAKTALPPRIAHYARLMGVTYGRITIRSQRSRWGSCSSKGNLNFNCLLMLTPPEVIDSVIVHELCHRKEMNHSKEFYKEICRVYPEYDKWNRWLKEHGPLILRRMTG